MMDFKLTIILIAACFTGIVLARCPKPDDIPVSKNGKYVCARAYETGHHVEALSCKGEFLDIPNGDITRNAYENKPFKTPGAIGALVVRPGCHIEPFGRDNFKYDDSLKYNGVRMEVGVYPLIYYDLPGKIAYFVHDLGRFGSWVCDCAFTNAPFECKPEESYKILQLCNNPNVPEMSCDYEVQSGMVLGTSVTHGESISHSVEVSVGLSIKGIFESELSYSTSTSYDWSHTNSEEYSKVTTRKVNCKVEKGQHVILRQVIGKCGDTVVYTAHFECRGNIAFGLDPTTVYNKALDIAMAAMTAKEAMMANSTEVGEIDVMASMARKEATQARDAEPS
ncbi:uncharacterized protein LOC135153866 [Lytechinus pictus]|uniref:uncharacterized protein LOC135153866 n=1 Tax=Lytechinus pictus TaxID=7653 RepID=UPI0030BA2A74